MIFKKSVSTNNNPLRLNVGFIIHQPVGYSREFSFDLPHLYIDPDLDLFDFSGKAQFTRTPQGLLTQIDLKATTPVECVRCLNIMQQPLHAHFTELYAFSSRSASESELILPENGYLDLGPITREYLILEIPISPLCKPECKGLCPICGENLSEVEHSHEDQDIDPRLSSLQALLEE